MLILSRFEGEKIVIGNNIIVTVVEIDGAKVRLGIEAPREIPVDREEVREKKSREQEAGNTTTKPHQGAQ